MEACCCIPGGLYGGGGKDPQVAVQGVRESSEGMLSRCVDFRRKEGQVSNRAGQAISHPLKEGHHFDQSLGGVAGFFENMRVNTQELINTNIETEKAIKSNVLPVLERLHKEIKHKVKELAHGAQKGAKEVEKARNTTQKHIELLGQQTASFDSAGGKMATGVDDPYVVKRGVLHRLSKQVLEENAHRNETLAVQNNFEDFERHVVGVLQQAIEAFVRLAAGQGEKARSLHSDMLGAIQRVPPDFEWKAFISRSGDRLVDPNENPRIVDAITFPNMDHTSTAPLIEGSLDRKSRNKLAWGYSTAYYVVTPAKFLHEFKDTDNSRHEPKPELSIYLPDATIGQPNGEKFNIKGKDKSKSLSSKLTGSSELAFKAHTAADAENWFKVIKDVAGATGPVTPLSPTVPDDTTPPPMEDKLVMNEAADTKPEVQESGVTQDSGVVVAPEKGTAADTSLAGESSAAPAHAPVSATTEAGKVHAPVVPGEEKKVVA